MKLKIETKELGPIQNGKPMATYASRFSQLKKYEEEDYFTFQHKEYKGLKVFVKNSIIRAIQSTQSAIFKDQELIGIPYQNLRNLFPFPLETREKEFIIWNELEGFRAYFNAQKTVFCVVLHDWQSD